MGAFADLAYHPFSDVFILGLDQHNLAILRGLLGASDIAFRRLLPIDK